MRPAGSASSRAEHLPLSAGWRDVHLRLAGPQQAEVAESFDRSWRRAHGHPLEARPRPYRQARLAGAKRASSYSTAARASSTPGPAGCSIG